MRFKFLFGHKAAARKPAPSTYVPQAPLSRFAAKPHDETILTDFDEGNDDVTAIRSSLGLGDNRRPASE
jgi:hypothetical protein